MITFACYVCIIYYYFNFLEFLSTQPCHENLPQPVRTECQALHPQPSDIPQLPMLFCSAVTTQESRSLLGCWVDNIVPLLSHNNEVIGLERQCHSSAKNPAGWSRLCLISYDKATFN